MRIIDRGMNATPGVRHGLHLRLRPRHAVRRHAASGTATARWTRGSRSGATIRSTPGIRPTCSVSPASRRCSPRTPRRALIRSVKRRSGLRAGGHPPAGRRGAAGTATAAGTTRCGSWQASRACIASTSGTRRPIRPTPVSRFLESVEAHQPNTTVQLVDLLARARSLRRGTRASQRFVKRYLRWIRGPGERASATSTWWCSWSSTR